MSRSNSTTSPQTTSNVVQVDRRLGIEGENNLVQGDGGLYASEDTSISAPISGDDNFAPIFNVAENPTNPQGGVSAPVSSEQFDVQRYLAARADLAHNWNNSSPANDPLGIVQQYGTLEAYALADFQANRDGNHVFDRAWYDEFTRPAPSGVESNVGGGVESSVGTFAGAGDNGAVTTGGNVTGPVASGDDSSAAQANDGGVVIAGDVDAPILTAPIGGGSVIVGGDVAAPVVTAPVAAGGIVAGGDVDAQIVTAPIAPGGVVIGGDVDAPIVTAPISDGGVSVIGDVAAPIVSAPISGPASFGSDSPVIQVNLPPPGAQPNVGTSPLSNDPPAVAPVSPLVPVATNDSVAIAAQGGGITAAGDVEANGPVISGNSAPVSIFNSDPEVTTAAIASAGASLTAGLAFADRALAQVADSKKDPSERTTGQILNALTIISLAFGIYSFLRKKGA